jgi:hypothetical protein
MGEALLEAAVLGQQAVHAVLQHALFVGEIEVHVYRPRTVLARMLRWISFDPPTMDTWRAQ